MKQRPTVIRESNKVLDSFEMKSELNPDIFDKKDDDYVMKPTILKSLQHIAHGFMEFLGVEFFIHDVILTGSLANYNWSKYSDVDLHIIIDFEETDHDPALLKEFFDAKKVLWNSMHDIKVKSYECEIYVQDINDKLDATGVYSVLNNKWVLHPERKKVKLDKKKIHQKAEDWIRTIDDLVKHKDEPGILTRIDQVREHLKKYRTSGLDSSGEFSIENLVFKYLRRNDYIKKLLDLKNEVVDKDLSLNERRDAQA